MEGIFNLLMIDVEDVCRKTLECLVEITKLNYSHMATYLSKFYQITEAFMLNY
jgi:hypothetical protein